MHRMGRQRHRPGFTLIELVTVTAILGIVAVAVGGPTLAYVDTIRSRAAASRLAGDIRYAQRTALNCGLQTWILFDSNGDSYQLYLEDRANPGKAGRQPCINPLDLSTDPAQFGSGVFSNVAIVSVDINGTGELEFDSFGVPYDGGRSPLTDDGFITLSGGVTVVVHPVGGFVERSG